MVEVSTSILTVPKDNIVKTIYNLEIGKTDYFHIDVMDGKFVDGFTSEIMEEYCEYIKSISTIPLDIHLMVKDVKKYVDKFLIYEPNIITFHIEAIKRREDLIDLINYIKSNNCKVGIAINPDTNITKVLDVLNMVHMCLVMTVVPGKGGKSLIVNTIDKIKDIKSYIDKNNLDIDIEADGGIKLDNVEKLKEAGANILVSGTGILSSDNYGQIIKEMKV